MNTIQKKNIHFLLCIASKSKAAELGNSWFILTDKLTKIISITKISYSDLKFCIDKKLSYL